MNANEISLFQALVAVLSEAKESGVDIQIICDKAKAGIGSNKMYRTVGNEYIMGAIESIERACEEASKA